jgi:tetratricopeptide (TPR) repeat protein
MVARLTRCVVRLLLVLALLSPSAVLAGDKGSGGSVYVRGYTRSNGTYVAPYYRSAPDGNFYNNWSTKGNVNPYTGKPGTRVTPPSNYGGYQPSYYGSFPSSGSSVPGFGNSSAPGFSNSVPGFSNSTAGQFAPAYGAKVPATIPSPQRDITSQYRILYTPRSSEENRIPAPDNLTPNTPTRITSAPKPKSAEAYFLRATAYLKESNPDKAIADCTEAIRLDPKYAEAFYFRGVVYREKGELRNAQSDFDRATELGFKP